MLHPIARRLLPAACLAFSAATALTAAPLAWSAEPKAALQPLDRIVAVVNQTPITQRQLNAEVQRVAAQINARNLSPADYQQLEERVLDRMITESVELQRADQLGIRVSDAELDAALDGIAQRNGLSINGLQAAVQQRGETWDQYRNEIRKQIVLEELKKREVYERVEISDRDIDDYLKQYDANQAGNTTEYHVAQILISVPENASPDQVTAAKARADAALAALKAGEPFEKVSAERSDAPNAVQGGDLGWRDAARIPSLFMTAIESLKPGQFSGLIRSPNGFHIVKLLDERQEQAKQSAVTEYDAEHVLIAVNAQRNAEAAKALAEKLRQEVVSGKASFASIAAKYSDDKGSAANGGQLGWVKPADMVPEFASMLEKTPVGTVSPVFETQFGYHFLEVLKTRQVAVSTAALRAQARQAIGQRRAEEDLVNYIRRLRAEAYIDNRLTGQINDADQTPQ
ncbi:peptidylprolyl isomerase [Halothiobacillus sp. DCM-1]|uniref:peptidylprolyl isomerase n=1 Tax=Halothiobacillus sp. DCM-1 TaxID=3112558 RepID=UPI00324BF541